MSKAYIIEERISALVCNYKNNYRISPNFLRVSVEIMRELRKELLVLSFNGGE